jgi:hypothetical protein
MRGLLALSALAFALASCTVERTYAPEDNRADLTSTFGNDLDQSDDWAQDDWSDAESFNPLPITEGRVRGDIGAVRGFDAPTDYVDSYGDEYWTSITLNATDEQGRMGMIILDIGNMDIQSVAAGTYSYSAQELGGSEIYVTGCSSSADTEYDAPAEDGTVVVRDNPDGTRDVNIEATLPDDAGGTTKAQGSFTLE